MRKYGRKDMVQPECEQALKRLHIPYFDLSSVGNGFPDLIVCHNSENILFEIKTKKALLTKAEAIFHAYWHAPCYVICSVDGMLRHLGLWKEDIML